MYSLPIYLLFGAIYWSRQPRGYLSVQSRSCPYPIVTVTWTFQRDRGTGFVWIIMDLQNNQLSFIMRIYSRGPTQRRSTSGKFYWWQRNPMKTLSALLAHYGSSVMRNLDVSFVGRPASSWPSEIIAGQMIFFELTCTITTTPRESIKIH